MAGKLRGTMAFRNPETQEVVSLLAGSEVPEWAVGLVHPDDLEDEKPKRPARAASEK